MKYDVLMITFGTLDIIVHLQSSFPIKAGDAIMFDDSYSEPGGFANLAIILSRLGGSMIPVGPIGCEPESMFLLKSYKENGIPVEGLQQDPDYCCEISYCFVDDQKQHTFILHFPKKFKLNEELLLERLDECGSLYTSGYSYAGENGELLGHLGLGMVRKAKQTGKPIFFDPGPMIRQIAPDVMKELLKSAYMISLNHEEAEIITGPNSVEQCAIKLQELSGGARIIVKDGVNGCYYLDSGSSEGEWYPGFQVEVEDTMGCGDVFFAVVMYGETHGWDIDTSLRIANAAGASNATKEGTGTRVPTVKDIAEVFTSHGSAVPEELAAILEECGNK